MAAATGRAKVPALSVLASSKALSVVAGQRRTVVASGSRAPSSPRSGRDGEAYLAGRRTATPAATPATSTTTAERAFAQSVQLPDPALRLAPLLRHERLQAHLRPLRNPPEDLTDTSNHAQPTTMLAAWLVKNPTLLNLQRTNLFLELIYFTTQTSYNLEHARSEGRAATSNPKLNCRTPQNKNAIRT